MRQSARWLALLLLVGLSPGCSSQSPSPSPTPAPTLQSLVGQPLNGSGAAVYRLMEDGQIRHIHDLLTFQALGYSFGQVVTIPPQELAKYPLGAPLTRWATGQADGRLAYLQNGKRYSIKDSAALMQTGGLPTDVSAYPDEYLNSFPLASNDIPPSIPLPAPDPSPSAAAWHQGALWVADDTGDLTRWNVQIGERAVDALPDHAVATALMSDGKALVAGTRNGEIWERAGVDGPWKQVAAIPAGWISSLSFAGGELWLADLQHYDFGRQSIVGGSGLSYLLPGQPPEALPVPSLPKGAASPLNSITALLSDSEHHIIWIGTSFAGLLRYDVDGQTWTEFNSLNSDLPDNHVTALAAAPDGSVWIGAPSGLVSLRDQTFTYQKPLNRRMDAGVLSLAVARDGTVWVSGENYVASLTLAGGRRSFTPFEHPFFLDRFGYVVLDDGGRAWFVGHHHLIHFDGQVWQAFDTMTGEHLAFEPGQPADGAYPPRDFPSPQQDYRAWLETWPRPEQDNGRCIHYLQTPSGDDYELRQQIARMQRLNLRWVLVNYTDRSQLLEMAPRFKQAGITAIWRPFIRPAEVYPNWAEDVAFLRSQGIPPYMQIYNEASIAQEWDGQPADQETYFKNLLPAIREVYDAGGYVGLQDIEPSWTKATLDRIVAQGMSGVYDRLIFVPHPYGANHPPGYTEDITAVLGFREYARIFQQEIGFVPPMIAGEGGWRPGDASDTRFPPISEPLHRDYNVALFNWFSAGRLSNGEPLPDYLFAFCPWLLSDPHDPAAWFDSSAGDRSLTIQAVEALPDSERLFSWQKPMPRRGAGR